MKIDQSERKRSIVTLEWDETKQLWTIKVSPLMIVDFLKVVQDGLDKKDCDLTVEGFIPPRI